eukprot:gb/GECG01009059.1/.p1 GENE.gb/GECG01009059.1/~~gb/GECG01009059.1/.p1  ORF type:complete len:103 (+),score=3.84 gb/GECG01009059.1/:1-309(+)
MLSSISSISIVLFMTGGTKTKVTTNMAEANAEPAISACFLKHPTRKFMPAARTKNRMSKNSGPTKIKDKYVRLRICLKFHPLLDLSADEHMPSAASTPARTG